MDKEILKLINLSFHINGKSLLNNITISFEKGKIYAIVGPNGAGKSTLASVIMGLRDYRNVEGEIIFKNKRINRMTIVQRARLGITMAWQQPVRFEGLSVREYLQVGMKEQNIKKIKESLLYMGLSPDEYLDRKVDKTLSGGERKKIELASILVMEPDFVMLDEPDSGIDVESLTNIFKVVHNLKTRNKTVLLITHSLKVLQQAEYAFLLCHGEVIDRGNVNKIIPYFQNKCIPCVHKNMPKVEEVRLK